MITFNPLWKTLKIRKLNKTDLQKMTGLSSATIAKLSKEENSIMLNVVDRIAIALDVPVSDVIESINYTGSE